MSRSDEKALGTRVDSDTLGRVADAVIALSGSPVRMTKKRLVVEALCREVRRLEKKHNRGKPFKVQRDRRLIPGVGSDARTTVGRRKAEGVATRARARARPRAKRTGDAPARARRKRKR